MSVCVGSLSHLYYRVGRVDKERVEIEWSKDDIYGKGASPDVTLLKVGGRLFVVEVHTSEIFKVCYYHIGEVDTDRLTIAWGSSVKLCKGLRPKVCAKDNGVVIVINEQSNSINQIKYHIGKLQVAGDDIHIEWDESYRRGRTFHKISGVQPSIAMSEESLVVVAYRDGQTTLRSIVGVLIEDSQISWGFPLTYETGGTNPSIGIDSYGNIVECHQSKTLRKLYHMSGKIHVQHRRVNWSTSIQYTSGSSPFVSLCNDGYVLETHASNVGTGIFHSQGWLKVTETVSGEDSQQKKTCADFAESYDSENQRSSKDPWSKETCTDHIDSQDEPSDLADKSGHYLESQASSSSNLDYLACSISPPEESFKFQEPLMTTGEWSSKEAKTNKDKCEKENQSKPLRNSVISLGEESCEDDLELSGISSTDKYRRIPRDSVASIGDQSCEEETDLDIESGEGIKMSVLSIGERSSEEDSKKKAVHYCLPTLSEHTIIETKDTNQGEHKVQSTREHHCEAIVQSQVTGHDGVILSEEHHLDPEEEFEVVDEDGEVHDNITVS